jgi:twitching motility protein PilT
VNAGDVIELVLQAHRDGASDVLLSSGLAARVRLGGSLQETALVCEAAQIIALASRGGARSDSRSSSARQRRPRRSTCPRGQVCGRCGSASTCSASSAGWRPRSARCAAEVPGLAQLGLPDDFKSLVQFTSGLVLMTGPTGSGKSTTLSSLIEHVNLTAARST